MERELPLLDPTLFGPSPARDARFTVKERWVECVNLSEDHPEKTAEFLHRQMNEEINGLEISASCLADFPDADWQLRMSIARQCADEARHVRMFQRMLEERGGRVGDYPVLNFQYRIIANIDNLIGRLAVQNRSFEAEGIDAIQHSVDETRKRGESDIAEFYEAQLADEITHVRYANAWVRTAIHKEPGNLLRVSAALTAATKAFQQVMGAEGTTGIPYLANTEGRLEAGFLPDEVQRAMELTLARRTTNLQAEQAE